MYAIKNVTSLFIIELLSSFIPSKLCANGFSIRIFIFLLASSIPCEICKLVGEQTIAAS